MRLLGALVAIAFLSACGSEAEPSLPAVGNVFQVELSPRPFKTITAVVNDQVGLVVAVHTAERARLREPMSRQDVAAQADGTALLVVWLGGICRFGPTITLTGSAAELLVTVRPEEGPGLPPGIACEAIGVFYAVSLALAEPVQQDAVTVTLVR